MGPCSYRAPLCEAKGCSASGRHGAGIFLSFSQRPFIGSVPEAIGGRLTTRGGPLTVVSRVRLCLSTRLRRRPAFGTPFWL